MNRKVLFWVLALVVVVGCVLVYFSLFKESIPEESISNWKVYSNEEFGYSFKYPSRFDIVQPLAWGYEGGNILVDEGVSYITVYVVKDAPSMDGSADLTLGGYGAKFSPPFGKYRSGVSIYKGDNLIVIYLQDVGRDIDEDIDSLIRDIVSTIELTN